MNSTARAGRRGPPLHGGYYPGVVWVTPCHVERGRRGNKSSAIQRDGRSCDGAATREVKRGAVAWRLCGSARGLKSGGLPGGRGVSVAEDLSRRCLCVGAHWVVFYTLERQNKTFCVIALSLVCVCVCVFVCVCVCVS